MIVREGRCSHSMCQNRRVRRNGTMAKHPHSEWPRESVCSGSGRPAVFDEYENGVEPRGIPACVRCRRAPAVRGDQLCCDCQAEIAGVT